MIYLESYFHNDSLSSDINVSGSLAYILCGSYDPFQCLSLLLWLEERYETVYMRHPGFQQGSKPLLTLDNPFPTELPENLFGERWAFVQLPYSGKEATACMSFISQAHVFILSINILTLV